MSENVVFDTNILIDYAKGKEEAREVFMAAERRIISLISRVEFLTGIESEHATRADAFLESNFEIFPLNLEVCMDAAKFAKDKSIPLPNALVAATAKRTQAKLLTVNTQEYSGLSIKIENPYQKA